MLIFALVFTLCGCSLIDQWLEVNEEESITPANPHVVADYGNGIYFFWDDFCLSLTNGDLIFAFSNFNDLNGYDFQVTEWLAEADTMQLKLSGVRREVDPDTLAESVYYCKVSIQYVSTPFSSVSYASFWPEAATLQPIHETSTQKMVQVDGTLALLCETPNENTLTAQLTSYWMDETGAENTIDLFADGGTADSEQELIRLMINDSLTILSNPTQQQQIENIPSSLCFWTKELALQFPCTQLKKVANGVVEWTAADEAGTVQNYTLMRDYVEEGAESPTAAIEFYQANKAAADPKQTEEIGTALVAYQDYYLIYDSLTNQLYRLYIQ